MASCHRSCPWAFSVKLLGTGWGLRQVLDHRQGRESQGSVSATQQGDVTKARVILEGALVGRASRQGDSWGGGAGMAACGGR